MLESLAKRPYFSLLPFFIFYVLIILTQSGDTLIGDEGRYLWFAANLSNGFYSPPPPQINLWNGPGFPAYLLPFVVAGMPYLVIRLFNAVLCFCTLLIFHKTLTRFFDAKRSFVITLIYGCYYMPYKSLPFILSETLTVFLISGITFYAVSFFSGKSKPGTPVMLSLLLAALALTKVIFGQVFLFAGIAFFLLYLFTRNILYRKSSLMMLYALLFCLPYLVYTHALTGRIFYWSNAGGMSLYWMSNPVKGEWGEWHNDDLTSPVMDTKSYALLQANHREEYAGIHTLQGVARDDKFKEVALHNITGHPGKFILNWLANWSRMLFNYPVSYVPFTLGTAANMLANIPILLLLLYSTILTIRPGKKIPFSIRFLLILSVIYLLGTSLLSAYDRMFYILAPVFGLWISYALSDPEKVKSVT